MHRRLKDEQEDFTAHLHHALALTGSLLIIRKPTSQGPTEIRRTLGRRFTNDEECYGVGMPKKGR